MLRSPLRCALFAALVLMPLSFAAPAGAAIDLGAPAARQSQETGGTLQGLIPQSLLDALFDLLGLDQVVSEAGPKIDNAGLVPDSTDPSATSTTLSGTSTGAPDPGLAVDSTD